MRPFIFYVVGLVGGAIMTSPAFPADDFLCCPPFPLPLSLEVGNRWTYSITDYYWHATGVHDTLDTDTRTVRVVGRLDRAGHTYFELSNGGFYRVDALGRTWQYDNVRSEKLLWDVWGPQAYMEGDDNRFLLLETPTLNGDFIPWVAQRRGPFASDQLDEIVFTEIVFTEGVSGRTLSEWQETLLDLEVTEFYLFEVFSSTIEGGVVVFAPNVGVLFYWYYREIEVLWPETQSCCRKDGVVLTYLLETYERKGPVETVVEDVSFGQVKQRVLRPASNNR